jgi:predicted  nucleic acid-binding Zn-ribbon protein
MIQIEKVTVEVVHATCGRCGHTWTPKGGRIPKRCPACTSPYWNRERVHKPHEPRAAKPPKPTPEEIEAERAARTAAARAKLEAQRPIDSLVAAILAGPRRKTPTP